MAHLTLLDRLNLKEAIASFSKPTGVKQKLWHNSSPVIFRCTQKNIDRISKCVHK